MIEFIYKYQRNNYLRYIQDLERDLQALFDIYSLTPRSTAAPCLEYKFSEGLPDELWKKINALYQTLYDKNDALPTVLRKFINKKDVPRKKKFKFIDLFAGCGGLSLGLENAGFTPYFINEIEPNYLASYYFNRNISLRHYFCGDVKNIHEASAQSRLKLEGVDLVAGGPPCQGFSMANRQRIIDDPRNVLYKYYLNFLAEIRPTFFIMENVKGILSRITEIKEDFCDMLGSEYTIELLRLNARDFGIPQNRERVIILGSKLSEFRASALAQEIYAEASGCKQFFVLGDALAGLPPLSPNRDKLKAESRTEDVGMKYRKFPIPQTPFGTYINDGNDTGLLANHTNRFNNDRDIEIYSRLPQGANSLHPSIKDIMPYSSRNDIFKDKYFKLDATAVCKTITTHMRFDCNMYIHPTQSRGLSPREAARIQTFPDDFIFLGSNNSWYAQIGNAVPVKLAEVIGKILMKKLSKK